VGLLSSVSSNVASLVLQTVESLIAERALVRPGQVLSELVRLLRNVLQKRSHEAHGSSSHGAVGCGSGLLLNVVRRCVGVEQVTETCRGSVGLHVTECRSWGKGDDGGLVYMYGSTRRACGGRLVAVRAVCADAGEDMPEQVQKETRCASAPWLGVGGARVVETYQERRVPLHLRDDLRRGSVQRVQGVAGARLWEQRAFWRSRSRRRAGETECIPTHATCLSGLSGACPFADTISVEQQ
jgi:hypothetical protein